MGEMLDTIRAVANPAAVLLRGVTRLPAGKRVAEDWICRCGFRASVTPPARIGAATPGRSPPGHLNRPLAQTVADTLEWWRKLLQSRQNAFRQENLSLPARERELLTVLADQRP